MAQPEYVPVAEADRVRPVERLHVPREWKTNRPGELRGLYPPSGKLFGTQGPDQGYALGLARRFENKLQLAEGESVEDTMAGCVVVALRRAALFGRAPVIYDLEFAFTLWGFLGGAPPDLIEYRKSLFQSASHDYFDQAVISDLVPEETLRFTPRQVADRLSKWRTLIKT